MQDEARIEELTTALTKNRDLYYNEGRPEISDDEYDSLFRELESLELAAGIPDGDRFTQKVGAPTDADPSDTVRHEVPMLSLDNARNEEEFDKWLSKSETATGGPIELLCEHKVDGLSVSLLYENGSLTRAATRGDGAEGKDITANIKAVDDIPNELTGDFPERIEVRGEIYMSRARFDELNESLEVPMANPRNAASGAVMLKDPDRVKERGLSLWAYDTTHPFGSGSEMLKALSSYGLPVNGAYEVLIGLSDAAAAYDRFLKGRDYLPFDIDGMVIKANSVEDRKTLGTGSRAPKWAIAWKFPAQEKHTVLQSIETAVGRTGRVTPYAVVSPVEVDGSTVSKATLHNAAWLSQKDVRPGDTVVIRKAGDIIPEVVAPIISLRPEGSEPYEFPTVCPSCGTPLAPREDGPDMYCSNSDCHGRKVRELMYFSSKAAMDIDGLGESWAERLVSSGLVSYLPDLYDLSPDDMQRVLISTDRLSALPDITTAVRSASVKQDAKAYVDLIDTLKAGHLPGSDELLKEARTKIWAPIKSAKVAKSYKDVTGPCVSDPFSPIPSAVKEAAFELAVKVKSAYNDLMAARTDPPKIDRSIEILHRSIQASKNQPVRRLITGLGIELVGRRVSMRITKSYPTISALTSASENDIAALDKVGPAAAANAVAYFSSPEGSEVLARFDKASVGTAEADPAAETAVSKGRVLVTGTFSEPRTAIQARLESLGWEIAGSVSKSLAFIALGDAPGASKIAKAEKLGIRLIGPDELWDFAQNSDAT